MMDKAGAAELALQGHRVQHVQEGGGEFGSGRLRAKAAHVTDKRTIGTVVA